MKEKLLMSLKMNEFYVREDQTSARFTLIHHSDCSFCKKYHHDSQSSVWHGPLTKTKSIELSKKISHDSPTGWAVAGCCVKKFSNVEK